MKAKQVITCILLLSLSSGFYGQHLKLGIQGGIIAANPHVMNKSKEYTDYRFYYFMTSYHANATLNYTSRGKAGVTVEPGFIQKGGRKKETNAAGFQENTRYQLNYVYATILLEYNINTKLFLSAGTEIAYLINVQLRNNSGKTDISYMYNKPFEFSGVVGFGINVLKNLDLGIRYNHAITSYKELNVVDEFNNPIDVTIKEYNQYLQVYVRFFVSQLL